MAKIFVDRDDRRPVHFLRCAEGNAEAGYAGLRKDALSLPVDEAVAEIRLFYDAKRAPLGSCCVDDPCVDRGGLRVEVSAWLGEGADAPSSAAELLGRMRQNFKQWGPAFCAHLFGVDAGFAKHVLLNTHLVPIA